MSIKNFAKSFDIYKQIEKDLKVSFPVLRYKEDKYYLAFFFYEKGNLIMRPKKWALVNLCNGKTIEVFNTKNKDFSYANYTEKYNFNRKNQVLSKIDYGKILGRLDEIRKELIEKGTLNLSEYNAYIIDVVDTVPSEFKRFYFELSNVWIHNNHWQV